MNKLKNLSKERERELLKKFLCVRSLIKKLNARFCFKSHAWRLQIYSIFIKVSLWVKIFLKCASLYYKNVLMEIIIDDFSSVTLLIIANKFDYLFLIILIEMQVFSCVYKFDVEWIVGIFTSYIKLPVNGPSSRAPSGHTQDNLPFSLYIETSEDRGHKKIAWRRRRLRHFSSRIILSPLGSVAALFLIFLVLDAQISFAIEQSRVDDAISHLENPYERSIPRLVLLYLNIFHNRPRILCLSIVAVAWKYPNWDIFQRNIFSCKWLHERPILKCKYQYWQNR